MLYGHSKATCDEVINGPLVVVVVGAHKFLFVSYCNVLYCIAKLLTQQEACVAWCARLRTIVSCMGHFQHENTSSVRGPLMKLCPFAVTLRMRLERSWDCHKMTRPIAAAQTKSDI
jgi:hypothetical protein